MNTNDKQKFRELMIISAEATGFQLTDSTLKTYWALLNRIEIGDFEQAIHAHLLDPEQGMFFPKPANIMKHITGTAKQQEQAVKDTAEQAWHAIEGEIRRIGSYGTLKLENKQALAAVKAIGGWKHLCSLTSDQMTWAHKEFTAAYESYERADISMLPDKLPGRFELEEHKKESARGLKALADGVRQFHSRNNAKLPHNN